MRLAVAVAAALIGAGTASAMAQEPVRLDLDPQVRNACDWQEYSITKPVVAQGGARAPAIAMQQQEEHYSASSTSRFSQDGADWLLEETYPEYPQDTIYVRFDAEGRAVAGAYDQASLEQFAELTRTGEGPRDGEVLSAALGIYEPIVAGRDWRVGDPLFTPTQLLHWRAQFQSLVEPYGIVVNAASETVFIGVQTGDDGRERLMFSGPIRLSGGADPVAPAPAVWAITQTPEHLSLTGQIQMTAAFDRTTGHLAELRENAELSVQVSSELGVRLFMRVRADCRPNAGG